MARRIKRLRDFDISLLIKNDAFIRPPRDAQRNWLLNRALGEFVEDLQQLHHLAGRFVRGGEEPPMGDRTQAVLTDAQIMEDWQLPIMRAMAGHVTHNHGDVLEVGFGRGISATMIQEMGARSHTIVECNDSVVGRFEAWRDSFPDRDIRLVHAKWQDCIDGLGEFDGAFFHTYPLDLEEYLEHVAQSITFAEQFFAPAAAHLVSGGTFSYLTNEIDSLSRSHQRLLLQHFGSFSVSIVEPLNLPDDVADSWWADSMVVVKAVK